MGTIDSSGINNLVPTYGLAYTADVRSNFTEIKVQFDNAIDDLTLKLDKASVSAFILTLLDDANAATARSTLELLSMAVQAASSVTITGGSITGLSELQVGGNITVTGTVDGRDIAADAAGLDALLTAISTTANATAITIDASENVGIGAAPKAFGSTYSGLNIGSAGTIAAETLGGAGKFLFVSQNAFFNGTDWIYIATDEASNYHQTSGTHNWRVAPSGTAGTAITWTTALTIDNNANVGIGVTPSNLAGLELVKIGEANTAARLAIKSNETTAATYLRIGRFGTSDDATMTIGNNYNRNGGIFAADYTSAGLTSISFKESGELSFGTAAAGQTTPILALTLDATQNATFGGSVIIPDTIRLAWGDGNERIVGNNLGTLRFITGNVEALELDASQNATFGGDITMGAIAADHRLTVKSNSTFQFQANNAVGSQVYFGATAGTTPSAVISNKSGLAIATFGDDKNTTFGGNVGIDVTPEAAWSGALTVLRVGGTASIECNTAPVAGSNILNITTNGYFDTAWKYIITDEATRYSQRDGTHVFYVAPSGTADTAITFTEALTIDNSANATFGGNIFVAGNGTSAPLLTLQSDLGVNTRNMVITAPTTDSASAPFTIATGNSLDFVIDSISALLIDSAGNATFGGDVSLADDKNLSLGSDALATTATTGFIYLGSCAGTPTGIPTTLTGRIPLVLDSTNDILYYYNTSWKKVGSIPTTIDVNHITEKQLATTQATAYVANFANGSLFEITMTGNVAITFSNIPATTKTMTATFVLKHSGAGRTPSFPASVKWDAGVTPAWGTGAGNEDIVTMFTYDGGTTWRANLVGQNYA